MVSCTSCFSLFSTRVWRLFEHSRSSCANSGAAAFSMSAWVIDLPLTLARTLLGSDAILSILSLACAEQAGSQTQRARTSARTPKRRPRERVRVLRVELMIDSFCRNWKLISDLHGAARKRGMHFSTGSGEMSRHQAFEDPLRGNPTQAQSRAAEQLLRQGEERATAS